MPLPLEYPAPSVERKLSHYEEPTQDSALGRGAKCQAPTWNGKEKVNICSLRLSHKKTWRWGPLLKFLNFASPGVSQMPVPERKQGARAESLPSPRPEGYWKPRVTKNSFASLSTKFLYSIVYAPRSWILDRQSYKAETKNILVFLQFFSVNSSPQITLSILLCSMADNHNGSGTLHPICLFTVLCVYLLSGGRGIE